MPGLGVRLKNARPLTGWGEHSIPASEPLRQARLFRTCRNWQFGWWLKQNRNVPAAPTGASQLEEQPGPTQLTFGD